MKLTIFRTNYIVFNSFLNSFASFFITFWIFLVIFPSTSFAQNEDSLKIEKQAKEVFSIFPVPALGYSPETRWYTGAVVLFAFNFSQDTLTRTSNAKLEFNYTQNKQTILQGQWNYFTENEEWFTQGHLHYSNFPDLYYGIGANTPQSNELLYESDRQMFDFDLYKNIGNKLFTGFGVRYLNYYNIDTYDKQNPFSELTSQNLLGLKWVMVSDHRNNLLNATEGHFYDLELGYNWGNTDFTHLVVDLRQYYTFFEKYTLALRLFNSLNFGTPAFFDMSYLGGDQFVRGYYYGRYRDINMSTFQFETRAILWWRIGGAVFGGISTTYPDLKFAQSIRIIPNMGLGLRLLMDKDENINLRFDYAIGVDGQTGFYISFGESF